jgi:hypothetical protein
MADIEVVRKIVRFCSSSTADILAALFIMKVPEHT